MIACCPDLIAVSLHEPEFLLFRQIFYEVSIRHAILLISSISIRYRSSVIFSIMPSRIPASSLYRKIMSLSP